MVLKEIITYISDYNSELPRMCAMTNLICCIHIKSSMQETGGGALVLT